MRHIGMRSQTTGALLGVVASLIVASSALATECVNASKVPDAGAQVVIDTETGDVVWTTVGVANRIEQGLIDPTTGAGFHGLLGLDFNGDGVADVTTWFGVGPDGTELPEVAQFSGPACRGVTNIGIYLTQCLGG
jgi:hypothetical protein